MKKVSVLRGPKTRDILGLFTEHASAEKIANSLFPNIGGAEYTVEEMVLDPLVEELLEKGLLPWWVSVDVISNQAEIKGNTEAKLSDNEEVVYFQGKYAQVYVFAENEEKAEERALDLWKNYNHENKVEALTIFEVTFDENAEIKEIRRFRAVGPPNTPNTINYPAGNIVSFRVVAISIDEAITTAREMYDEWLDKQIVGDE
jgi:hypothetical protein